METEAQAQATVPENAGPVFGKQAVEIERGYVPLSVLERKDDEPPVLTLDDASADLAEIRPADDVKERSATGANDEPLPANVSLTVDDAFRTLANDHQRETLMAQLREIRGTQEAVDEIRGEDAENVQEPAATKAEGEEPAKKDEPAELPTTPDGVDPEIAKALENPKVREYLERHEAQYSQATEVLASGAEQAAQVAAASLMLAVPALQGMQSMAELPYRLAAMPPEEAERAKALLRNVDTLVGIHSQVQQRNEQARNERELQEWNKWAPEQDKAFVDAVGLSPQEISAYGEKLILMAEEYGVDRATLSNLYNSSPILRAAPFQRMMLDAVRYRDAKAKASQPARKPVPPVHRPGVALTKAEVTARDVGGEMARLRGELKTARGPKAAQIAAKMVSLERRAKGAGR